ncbi:Do family serine endopeptidase [Ancylobacter pratisalsi]|uniref:Probable periplasmic serine endoprotease DegP-like n=1 Tax=Ancylobacter pratisalsi TaxID=1745854 RepID=A0A6P1YMG5_9HYPH|nr:Do family serine endopeptidase [Ancylobacter pratisalsi]QIB33423.1 Do family serine endopeptidase [Ancylobacter pratisalsi]
MTKRVHGLTRDGRGADNSPFSPLRTLAAAFPRRAGALALSLVLAAGTLAGTLGGAPATGYAASAKGPDTVADTAERVMDAVVNISTSQTVAPSRGVPAPELPPGSPFEEFFEEFFKRRQQEGGDQSPRRVSSLGSGFVIDPAGFIVTNNHVIADADEIYANFADGSKLKAELVGRDTKIDLALLKVTPEQGKTLTAVKFGNSDGLRVGDWVMAIGNPFGLGGTLTVGVISARNRDINSGPYDNFLQTDAAINRGNSGGPLFNMDGDVIGINTAIISPSGGSIGIGFAVPSNTATPIVAQLKEFGETRRGWIGVRIQQVTPEIAESLSLGNPRGALVGSVTDEGPAAKGGIIAGDVIISFDGKEVKDMRSLPIIVADTAVDKEVDVVVIRRGKEETVKLVVGRLDESDDTASAEETPQEEPDATPAETTKLLGVEVSALTPELRAKFKIKDELKGVVIVSVEPGTPAADRGLVAGNLIVEVNQVAAVTPDDITRRLAELKKDGRRSALLMISDSEGQVRFTALPID